MLNPMAGPYTITFDANVFTPGGVQPAAIRVRATPYRPRAWPIPVGTEEFGTANTVDVIVHPEAPTLALEGSGDDWAWQIWVGHPDVSTSWARLVELTADANYLDLRDVDPDELEPVGPRPPSFLGALNATNARIDNLAIVENPTGSGFFELTEQEA